MRLYYFTPLRWARSNIERRRLKISRISELNDPYEFLGVDHEPPHGMPEELKPLLSRDGVRTALESSHGLISFSRIWTAPIMWSHYADRHRGACLGFDVHEMRVTPVTYRDALPSIQQDAGWILDQMLRLVATKHSAWSYEMEVRLRCKLENQEDGLFFKPFDTHPDQVILREVILGARCSDAELRIFRDLADLIDPLITVRRAKLSLSSYVIECD